MPGSASAGQIESCQYHSSPEGPGTRGAEGNEVADQFAKDATTGRAPREELREGYAEETSLARMTRVATQARSKERAEWITAHVHQDDATDLLLGGASDAPS